MSSINNRNPGRTRGIFFIGLLLLWPRTAWLMGQRWQTPPSQPPGTSVAVHEDPMAEARQRYLDGDLQGVVSTLVPWLDSRRPPTGRQRDSARLLLGMVYMELENWNLASTHFTQVRTAGGPLASYGAWYEAVMDHERGRHEVSIRECSEYRTQWPDGPKADECLLLMGDAHAALDHRVSSVASYEEYLTRNPDTPREEEIRIAIALAETNSRPEVGIRALQRLALHHSYPSTDLAVQQELERLSELGYDTALPTDPASLRARCESLRRSGRLPEAWEMFLSLEEQHPDDEELAEWIEENEERFARGTRNYDVYAAHLEARYEDEPTADLAWQIFRAWCRAGRWDNAVEWIETGEREHASNRRWRNGGAEMAWATMLSGDYGGAAERWSALSRRNNSAGRKARFYTGFSQLRDGDPESAIATLEPLRNRTAHWQVAAYYWSAEAQELLGNAEEATANREQVRLLDRRGWYTLLLDEREAQENGSTAPIHDGSWTGPEAPTLEPSPTPEPTLRTHEGQLTRESPLMDDDSMQGNALLIPGTEGDWHSLSWDRLRNGTREAETPVGPEWELAVAGLEIPEGYTASALYDPEMALEDFFEFSEAHRSLWSDLPAAYDLAVAGLYDSAARLVYGIYEEWRDIRSTGDQGDARRQRIANAGIHITDWHSAFLSVRDHYHTALVFTNMDEHLTELEDQLAARRLAYPIVFGRELYVLGQRFDVDPLLVLAIMRQESTYRNRALSPVGAIGLIQVMPSTGARVARLLGEARYSPGDLEEPMTNLRYGTYYLSRLMERFDGRYPMAVASYNGGPHNLSRWYRDMQRQISMDVLVEQIMYDETRDYVKKVSGHYARYVRLYGETDARVAVPMEPAGDHPEIIDF